MSFSMYRKGIIGAEESFPGTVVTVLREDITKPMGETIRDAGAGIRAIGTSLSAFAKGFLVILAVFAGGWLLVRYFLGRPQIFLVQPRS